MAPSDDAANLLDLAVLEQQARDVLPADVFDYYAGGAGLETTLREASSAWAGWSARTSRSTSTAASARAPTSSPRRPSVRRRSSWAGR
jgi:4-hydroxymandelate oxidase